MTGGAGYVGSACLRWLLKQGHEAYAFDDTKPRLILGYAHALAESGQTERAKEVLGAGLVHFPNSDVMRRALRQLEERSPR